MSVRRRGLRGAVLASLAAAALGLARPAAAEGGVSECVQSYEAGQRLRREGDLVGAAAELLVCGGPACPVRMQGDCQRWLDDVERATPAVVFRVRDARGNWLGNVSVSIDGGLRRRLTGRAIAMNPGEHEVVFERPGYRPLATPVIVAEGEKLERRIVTLQALDAERSPGAGAGESAASDAPEPGEVAPELGLAAGAPSSELAPVAPRSGSAAEGPNLLGPLALGAVAVVGGLGFVYYGVHAQSGEADLEQCTPNCTQARVDDVKDDFLKSNISLGLGLAGVVGAGLWLLLDRPAALDGGPRAARGPRTGFALSPLPSWTARF